MIDIQHRLKHFTDELEKNKEGLRALGEELQTLITDNLTEEECSQLCGLLKKMLETKVSDAGKEEL